MAKKRKTTKKKSSGPPLQVCEGKPDMLEPDELILDPGNLRLLELADEQIQKTKVRLFAQETIQDKLLLLITENKGFGAESLIPVSYTHLTLPTKRIV